MTRARSSPLAHRRVARFGTRWSTILAAAIVMFAWIAAVASDRRPQMTAFDQAVCTSGAAASATAGIEDASAAVPIGP
jgi:hypothetical protein